MAVLEIVPEVVTVGNKDAPTVGIEGGEGVTVIERLRVKDVVTERVIVTDTVRVSDTVADLVNGCVVGMAVLEIVPDVLAVGNKDAPTVGIEGGEGVTVIERLYVKDVVTELVLLTDTV